MKGTVFQIRKPMERNNHFGLLELGSTFCGRWFPIPNLWDSLDFDCTTQDFLGPTLNLKSDMNLLKGFVRVFFFISQGRQNVTNIGGKEPMWVFWTEIKIYIDIIYIHIVLSNKIRGRQK